MVVIMSLMIIAPLTVLVWIGWNYKLVRPVTGPQRWAALIFGAVWLIIWMLLWRGAIAEAGARALRFWDESLPRLVLVVLASVLVGWWRMPAGAQWSEADIYGSLTGGLLAALLVGEINALIGVTARVAEAARAGYIDWLWWAGPIGPTRVIALDMAMLRALVIGPIGGLIGAGLAYTGWRWRALESRPVTSIDAVSQRHRGWLLVLRCAFFALGLNLILDSILTGAFREILDPRALADGNLLGILVGFILSGVGAGALLLILGLAAGAVTRRRRGWLVLGLTILGALAPFAGFGLIFGPGGGDQRTSVGGLGFLLILFGAPVFFGAYVWAMVLTIRELIEEFRNRRRPVTHAGAP